MNKKKLKEEISELLIKWSMPTRQAFINELLSLFQQINQEGYEEGARIQMVFDADLIKEARQEGRGEVGKLIKKTEIPKEMMWIIEMDKEVTNAYLEAGKLIGFNQAVSSLEAKLSELKKKEAVFIK